jgi:hypothetical protein
VSFEESLGRAMLRFGDLLGDLGLESPKEL